MKYLQWLKFAQNRLYQSTTITPKLDSEILLEKITGISRTRFFTFSETKLNKLHLQKLESLLIRREKGEPIAYLIGEKEFWSLNIKVSKVTMIPRPDTECLVEQSLRLLIYKQNNNVLDLGTGTGAIALAIATERPNWNIIGIDRYLEIISLARENADSLNLKNVQFLCGDWLKPFKKNSFDLIVANPPYLNSDDSILFHEIHFEPKRALISANNGLYDLNIICQHANLNLKNNGWIVLEHGWKQGKSVRNFLIKAGFCKIGTIQDYGGNERVSYGQWIN